MAILNAMAKKLAFVVIGLALIAVGLFAAGFRLALDGSGMRPRFVTKRDYDALEADRARQRSGRGG